MRLLPHHGNPLHNRIETLTVTTLHSQKVPTAIGLHLFAIVALNRDDLTQLRGDRLQCDTHRHGIPRGFHPFMSLGSLLAHGTPAVMARQFPKTVPMNGMAAG